MGPPALITFCVSVPYPPHSFERISECDSFDLTSATLSISLDLALVLTSPHPTQPKVRLRDDQPHFHQSPVRASLSAPLAGFTGVGLVAGWETGKDEEEYAGMLTGGCHCSSF